MREVHHSPKPNQRSTFSHQLYDTNNTKIGTVDKHCMIIGKSSPCDVQPDQQHNHPLSQATAFISFRTLKHKTKMRSPSLSTPLSE
ncbi:unnamed protein product [Cyberlindnera jadinii]|uniref:Uncharacterized protein n=1 Tax=Cyberlindnera jadinii (strain ATCC 18201 / CBS 1600 / BCRC 20928 / JCM 3617 / NBRC 0987 / NRRL Y-1542) TaxID=983966 RepID=A0A0H5C7W0_CYBJN|nr:unnamed protein product [Cyberlindnera jadinii]